MKEKTATSFRHAELREFLRSRRRALTPEAAGLPPRRRWGSPGLRLQDVAELAGVSTGWYSSFELGYAENISSRTVGAIAAALRLDESETAYLFHLTGTPQPHILAPQRTVQASLRRLVEQHDDGLAMLVDFRYDILAANDAAYRVGLAGTPEGFANNIFWRAFRNPICMRLSRDWRDVQAQHLVAILRRIYAESAGDARLETMIEELRATSAEFSALWDARSVASSRSRRLHFLLPTDAAIELETIILAAEGGLRVCYFIPVDDAVRHTLASFVHSRLSETAATTRA